MTHVKNSKGIIALVLAFVLSLFKKNKSILSLMFAAILGISLVACGGGGGGGTTGSTNNTTQNTGGAGGTGGTSGGSVDSTAPTYTIAQTNVEATGKITVRANETVRLLGLDGITVKDGTKVIQGTTTVKTDGVTLEWTPATKSPYNTTLSVTAQATDLAGNVGTTPSPFSVAVVTPDVPTTLFAGIHSVTSNNMVPVAKIALGGAKQSATAINFNGDGCVNMAINPKTLELHIGCRFGEQFRTYDLVNNVVTSTVTAPSVTTAALPVVCASSGVCYYGAGYTNSAQTLIVEDGVVTKTVSAPQSVRDNWLVPYRAILSGDTIYTLTVRGGTSEANVITRFNTATESYDTSIPVGQVAYGMCKQGDVIAVTVKKGTDGKDVLFFNARTGVRIGDIATPAGTANDCVFNGSAMYLTANDGVYKHTVTTDVSVSAVSVASTAFTPILFARNLAWSGTLNRLYATVPNEQIVELDQNLNELTRWDSRTDGGPVYISGGTLLVTK